MVADVCTRAQRAVGATAHAALLSSAADVPAQEFAGQWRALAHAGAMRWNN